MVASDGRRRVFVVWDSTALAVSPNLELLQRTPPDGFHEVIVLGLDRKGTGAIWRSNVEPNLRAAEVAVALIDLPNANVGFEIGFALGLAGKGGDDVHIRRVRLASVAGKVPAWLTRPPFEGQLVAAASRKSEIAGLITDGRSMEIPKPPSRTGDGTLFLCPVDGLGEGIGEFIAERRPHWQTPATEGWEIRELPEVLGGVGRVVWVILAFAGEEQRDGAENAAAAAIAGYALAHDIPLVALQHSEARDLLDVGRHRRKWTTIADLERFIDELDDTPPAGPLDPIDAHRRSLRIIHRDLVPFFAHVDKPLGDVFVELLLDVRPAGDGEGGCGRLDKLARHDLPIGLPATPTLAQLLEQVDGLSGRYVVLGEPGAGKSTLCRHLCFDLAKDADGPIPLFVSLARLSRDGQHDAFDLAEQDAAFHVGEDAARGVARDLRSRAEQGQVWLFLDGLDEVSGESARTRIRAAIEGFAANPNIARVIVTSREVGYDRLAGDFMHARVRPLSADGSQQRDLLGHWLKDRAEAVWQRIQQSPRVTDLARNPLLLTLLAMISLEDDVLPPTRVKLYGRAVRLLLRRGHGRDAGGVRDELAAEAILAPLSLKLHETGEDAWSEDDVNRLLRELTGDNATVRRDLASCQQSAKEFLDDVQTRSGLLGAYRGPGEPWRYMHRSLREFLAARALLLEPEDQRLRYLPSKGEQDHEQRDAVVNRWGETYALLVGLLPTDVARVALLGRLRELGADLVLRILPQVEGMAPDVAWRELSATEGWDGDHLLRMARGWCFDKHDRESLRQLLWPASANRLDVERLAFLHYALCEAAIPFDEDAFFADSGLPARPKPGWIESKRLPPDGRDHDTFWMGSPDGVGHDNEHPRHPVRLSAFRMSVTNVTEAQYADFDRSHRGRGERDHPVVDVSWWESRLFCRWAGGALPTEAQWEYACRAGSDTRWCFGDEESELERYAWYGNPGDGTHPVGKKKPNAFGLHDMHGNVWEWCADWSGPYPTPRPGSAAEVADDPVGPATGAGRVLRGGAYWNDADWARSAYRLGIHPGVRHINFGFRVAFPAAPRSRPSRIED